MLKAQITTELLVNKDWVSFDNFAVLDFKVDGKVIIEYAYCTYCVENRDTLDWQLENKLLKLGKDSLLIKDISSSTIVTHQYNQDFTFTALNTIKPSKLKKVTVQQFLVSEIPLSIKVVTSKFDNGKKQEIQFQANGRMWLDQPKHRGQWALKSFYGHLFLIYINRFSVNRNFPLLKLTSLKKGKLIGQPIPSIQQGRPFVLAIER